MTVDRRWPQDVVSPAGLATTSAVLLYDGLPHTPEWRAVRRGGITATDLPKILGLSRYGDALSVWAHKRGDLEDDEAGEAAAWGLILERPIGEEWARRRLTSVRATGVLAHAEYLWRRASPDFVVLPCPDGDGPCHLQVKAMNAFAAEEWKHEVPDRVLAQVQWEMAVSGYAHEHVVALIGGQRLVEHRVERDEKVIEFLIGEAQRVWGCVESGEPPAVEPSALHRRVLDALHPYRDGMASAPREQVEALLAARADATHEMSRWNREVQAHKRDIERIDSLLVELMGDAEALAIEGDVDPVVLYREISRAGYTVGPKSYRQIKVLEK